MKDFIIFYSLFLAKLLSLLLGFLAVLGLMIHARQQKDQKRETLSIVNLNGKMAEMQALLESEILEKSAYKKQLKLRKKAQKERALSSTRARLFVINFKGDIKAQAVESLRLTVSAILQVARSADQVVLLLESPGGLVHHYGLAAAQLERLKAAGLYLAVAVDLVAASGGYLMACVADKILAAPFAIVGSIGVLAQMPNFNRFLEAHAIDIEQHSVGDYKTTLTPLGKITDLDRARFKEEMQATHRLFKEAVKRHRPHLDIDKIANGGHWYASQSEAAPLIDEIITSDAYLLREMKNFDIYQVDFAKSIGFREKAAQILGHLSHKLYQLFP